MLENEIARLRAENVALKKEILSRGLPLPPGAEPELRSTGGAQRDVAVAERRRYRSQAMAFVGRLWHRFVDADRARGKANIEQELSGRGVSMTWVPTTWASI